MDTSPTTGTSTGDVSLVELDDERDVAALAPLSYEKTARDLERDLVRRARGYHQQIEVTTTSVVRKPIVPGTARLYQTMLREWELFVAEYEGVKDPLNLKACKDFILYFSNGRRGRNEHGGRLTVTYTHTAWKAFMAAWGRCHHISFSKSHQDTVLNFIKGGEQEASPDLSRKTRPPRNLTRNDFVLLTVQLVRNDWHDFFHERYRWGLLLLMLLHCNTSARRAEYERQLRYEDISIAVVWLDAADQPQIMIDFKRTKAKGLRDYEREQPEHMLYELVGLPFYCNAVLVFMAAVLADDVLRDYHSWEEICAIPRPPQQKHRLLEYHPDRKHWFLFPRSSSLGVLDHTKPSNSLSSQALVDLGRRVGFRDNVVLHAARREVLLQVDNYGYSCNERMRFAAHTNETTYRRSYQTAMPLVDGQAAFFEQEAQNQELHAFRRGYAWRRNPFHQPQLKESTRVAAEEVASDAGEDDSEDVMSSDPEQRQRIYDRRRQKRDALLREQHLAPPDLDGVLYESDFGQTRKLMPERDRLATTLFCEGSLRDETGRAVMNDLIHLCRSGRSATYCSGLNASDAHCDTCGEIRAQGADHSWWSHLYRCRQRSVTRCGSFAEFCFLCFRWYEDAATWQDHARQHLQDLPLKCNMVVFRHNVVRPALCPACLDEGHFRQFVNLTTWKNHLQDHLLRPNVHTCPHPKCLSQCGTGDKPAFLNHLADVHHIRFEKAERRQALKAAAAAAAAAAKPAHARTTEFSFVYESSDQYTKGGADDGRDCEGTDGPITTTGASSPPALDKDEDMISAMQDDHDSHSAPGAVDHHDEDDCTVTGHGLYDNVERGKRKGEPTGKAQNPEKTKILVMVPPVPDSWKNCDIPRIDALDDDDVGMAALVDAPVSGEAMRRARGRPRGSRNLATLRRERRMTTLAKISSPSSKTAAARA